MSAQLKKTFNSTSRKIFPASAKAPETAPIPQGAGDIAKLLGYAPGDTYWDYNFVFASDNGAEIQQESLGILHEAIVPLSKGGAHGLTLKLHDGFVEYHEQYTGVSGIVEVTEQRHKSNAFFYPQHSVTQQAAALAARNNKIADQFNGKVFMPIIPTHEAQEAVASFGGKTLITSEEALKFNSKIRVVTSAEEAGYNVAPFVVVERFADLEAKMAELMNTATALGIDARNAKYWVKFDNLSSGDGVKPFKPAEMSFDDIRKWARGVLDMAGMKGDEFVPMFIDIDIGSLPEVKTVLRNMNVQAVVSDSGVHVTGTTFQKTQDGVYLGGVMPQTATEKEHATEGQKWAIAALEDAQKKGYRGYAGIDVILCANVEGGYTGYVLEMNGRLNGSTSLLSTAQWVQEQSGYKELAAENLPATFRPLKDFSAFRKAFNDVLYKGKESNFEGIIPIILKPDANGNITGVKTIAVAKDAKSMRKLAKKYENIVRKLGG